MDKPSKDKANDILKNPEKTKLFLQYLVAADAGRDIIEKTIQSLKIKDLTKALKLSYQLEDAKTAGLLVARFDVHLHSHCSDCKKDDTLDENTSASLPIYGINEQHYAAQHNFTMFSTVKRFTYKGRGDPLQELDKFGRNIFHLMAFGPTSKVIRSQNETPTLERLQTTIKENSKIDIKAIDYFGFNVLHYAAWRGDLALVKWLVTEKTLDIKQASFDGLCPTHLALWSGHQDVHEWLIKNSADPYAKTKYDKDHGYYEELGQEKYLNNNIKGF